MIPPITNKDLLSSIHFVKESKNKNEALQKAFSIIVQKYQGHRFFTYLLLWRVLEMNPNSLWRKSGFLHCTQQNFLLRVILVQSGWFADTDIKSAYSLVWYVSPHQYLRVHCDNKYLAIDPWNFAFGAPFGTYAVGFGHKSI